MDNSSLKSDALGAVSWHFGGQIAKQFSSFVIGIILARLLSPSDFGVIALASVFISVTYAFVDSGFASALIQKKNCTEDDYSTVFFFNLIISIFFYLIIFLFSGTIASYFNNDKLINVIRVLGVLIMLYAFSSIQVAILKKELNFKMQANVIIFASVVSGGTGVGFAYAGFGVWSLVIQSILNQLILVVIYWMKSKWKPKFVFSIDSLKSLFAFGSKLLVTGIIYQIYNNFSSVIIAKFYSMADLGFYNRAVRFQQLASNQIVGTVSEVTFPLFANIQDDTEKLLKGIRLSIRATFYISTPLSLGMLILSNHIILGLIGEKWDGSIEYLRLLSIYAIFYPLAPILTNAIMAIGRSDVFMKLEIFRRVLDISVLLVGAFIGIKEMISTMILVIFISSTVAYFIVNKLICYKLSDFLNDFKNVIITSLAVSLVNLGCLFLLPSTIPSLLVVTICIVTSIIMFVICSELMKANEYILIKEFVSSKIIKSKKNRIK